MNDSVKFRIPASFAASWAYLTPGELRYGYDNEWLTSEDVVKLALAGVVPGSGKMDIVSDISLLLSDELYRLPELMDQLADRDEEVWTYLALAWVHENQAEFDEPLEVVERLYADFGYPDDVASFVRFMPPPTGGLPGMLGIKQRWQQYLNDKRTTFLVGRSPEQLREGLSE